MSSLQRIALSLLITVILSSIFVFLAFTGLFSTFELEFFNKRVQAINQNDLSNKIEDINTFHTKYRERFKIILGDLDIQKIYTSQWDEEYITKFHNLIRLFEEEYKGIQFIWFYDDKLLIHYSSADFAEKSSSNAFRKVYKNVKEASENIIDYKLLNIKDEKDFSITLDSIGNQIIYKFAAVDSLGMRRGTAILVVFLGDLRRFLIENGSMKIDGEISIYEDGYIFGGNINNINELSTKTSDWENIISDSTKIYTDLTTGKDFILISDNSSSFGNVAELVDADEYKLNEFLIIFLLIAFFITTYLIIFLIFSLRQDKIVVINGRIKKLQSHFLREYIENRDNLDVNEWQRKLRYKGDALKKDIRRGIGRIKKDKSAEVDNLIDKSWNELLEVIDNRIVQANKGTLEISNLEEVLKKILDSTPTLAAANTQSISKKKEISSVGTAILEGDGEEELEPLEEIEEVEELSELDGEEELESLEEIEGVEELSELDGEEELESLEEIEEAEELEELDEIEPVTDDTVPEPFGKLTVPLTEGEEVEEAELQNQEPFEERSIENFEEVKGFSGDFERIELVEKIQNYSEIDFNGELKDIGYFQETFKVSAIIEMEEEAFRQLNTENQSHIDDGSELIPKVHILEEFIEMPMEEKLENLALVLPEMESDICKLELVSEDSNLYDLSYINYSGNIQGYLEVVDTDVSVEERVMTMEKSEKENDEIIEEFEELEELEELEEVPVLNFSGSLNERLDLLSSNNIVEIADLQAIPELNRTEETISMEDGIFQIKDDVFSNKVKPKDENLKKLVDSVSDDEKPEEEEYVNILDILNVDLPINDTSKTNYGNMVKKRSSIFSESGFNYDSFRSYFKKSNIGIVQSLMKISQQFDAVFAGLLILNESTWTMDHSLGFNQESIDNFIFSKDDDFSEEIFEKKKILLFKSDRYGIKEIEDKLFKGDLSYMNGGLFIPVIFEEVSAYMFMGLKKTRSISWYIENLQNLKY